MATRTNVVHGARVVVKYNGKVLTLAQNYEVTELIPLGSVDPLGQHASAEHIELSYEVNFTMSIYRASQASLKSAGLFPNTGRPRDILTREGVMLEVYDLLDDVVLERLVDCKVEECSRGYSKGNLTMYNIRGKAIMASDEGST